MSEQKRVTVKDIAKELNISIGTVSKALSGKRGISDEMRAEIFKAAKEIGYSVNRLAQSLARKPIKIGIVYPATWDQYYGPLIAGMQKAIDQLRDYSVSAQFVQFASLYSTQELFSIANGMLVEGVDAIILCPASVTACEPLLHELQKNGTPVFLVGNDVGKKSRVACVQINAQMAGHLAGEIMGYLTPPGADIIAFIGDEGMQEHMDKVNCFKDELGAQRRLIGVFETQDEPEIAAHLVRKAVREISDIKGIYIATCNSVSICQALTEIGRDQEIQVVATDLYDDLIPFIENRTINALIYQHPEKQGEKAVMACYRYIAEGKLRDDCIQVAPDAIFRSHITGSYIKRD
jgi:LacI family transcriptional regulator